MQALPSAAYFLFAEAAAGGIIALFWIHLRDTVPRGFTVFTGACLLTCGLLAVWLRLAFAPVVVADINPAAAYAFALDRTLGLACCALLALYLVSLRIPAWAGLVRLLSPVVPLLALLWLWSAALVDANAQLGGLGVPLAVLAGGMALGTAVVALSLGHWYLVSPTLSVRPLVRLTFLCLGAVLAQVVLLPLLIALPGPRPERVQALFGEYLVFFGVRVVFGLLVPLGVLVMTWRTARIRSLDSATGLLYIAVALILAGEIAARTLLYLSGLTT
ncbi:MAG: hypothetical protein M3336_01860 [Chloroflexota bacterium]|nr:hypothetical protein [Chloroflexota bacterium]